MNFTKRLILFLVINFGGLAIGSWFMNNGPQSDWYLSLNQAPWTPPGWVFGLAWTTIMICFSIYMAFLCLKKPSKKVIILFSFQFILNVIWNYIFFNQHLIAVGLVVIVLLTLLVFYFYFKFNTIKAKYLLLPYMIWLCIASSLNAYILLNN